MPRRLSRCVLEAVTSRRMLHGARQPGWQRAANAESKAAVAVTRAGDAAIRHKTGRASRERREAW